METSNMYSNETEIFDVLEKSSVPHSMETQFIVGVYLTVFGILGVVENSVVLGSFFKLQSLASGGHSLLVNLCVSDLALCIFGFPFSASSSFANRWLFGDVTCQAYAFMGFLFGSASICTLMMLAIDRYLTICQPDIKSKLKSHRYRNMLIFIWCYGVFWAILPLIGWARYNYEPSRTTCTIDWQNNDVSYITFIITYFIFGYALPLSVMIFCYWRVIEKLSSKQRGGHRFTITGWAAQKNLTKLCILLVVAFIVYWSGYAVVCLWTVFAEPSTVPSTLALLPPLMAKISPVLNPILYIIMDQQLCQAVFGIATCSKSIPLPTTEPIIIQEEFLINASESPKNMNSDSN